MPVIVPVKAWADYRVGGTVYYIDGQPIAGVGVVPLSALAGSARGALVVGTATVWVTYAHPGAANRILTTDANDTIWSSNTLDIAGNSTINGSLVGSISGGGTVATGGFTLTVPATGTAALRDVANTFTALNTFGARLVVQGGADAVQFLATGHTTQAVGTPMAQITRADTAAGVSAMLGLTALGGGANGDGGAIYLQGASSTTAAQDMARISWLWTDATHATRNARLQFDTYPDGSNLGHTGLWSSSAVTDAAQTVIANGTGDVGKAITTQYVVYAITGTDSSGGTVSLAPNQSFIIYNDGTDALTLAVAADGSVTVQRTAGADTFDVTLWMTWM